MIKHGGGATNKNKDQQRKSQQNVGSLLLKTQRAPVRGYISALRPGPNDKEFFYEVKVRPDRSFGANRHERSTRDGAGEISQADVWMPLAEDPAVIAMLYGDKDMILGIRCRVEFAGATPETGVVFIQFDPNRRRLRGTATEFERKAYLYAVAGGGSIT